jgi:hypothetical protein
MMTGCIDFHPTHQAQLTSRWGGKHGKVNCTACAAGMVGEADTCGELRFTGSEIRAHSNEADPDPDSPGLNLSQVDAALRALSNGRIDLDTRKRYPFESLRARLNAGSKAILQVNRGVLVDAGQVFGNGFRGGHAIAIGADDGEPWIDDPLTKRFRTDWETLRQAAGRLVLNTAGEICGIGKAYVAFSRRQSADGQAPAATERVHVGPNPDGSKRAFGVYTVEGRAVVATRVARTGGFSANARSPHLYGWPGHPSQQLVELTSGALFEQFRDAGKTVAVRSAYLMED